MEINKLSVVILFIYTKNRVRVENLPQNLLTKNRPSSNREAKEISKNHTENYIRNLINSSLVSKQSLFRTELLNSIDNHIIILNNNSFFSKFNYDDNNTDIIKIYDNILSLIDTDLGIAFKQFYNHLNGIKNPTYLTAGLIFYFLSKNYLTENNRKYFSQSYFCKVLKIASSSFSKMFKSLYYYFQKLPDYEPIDGLVPIQSLSCCDYIELVRKNIRKLILILNRSKNFHMKLLSKDSELIFKMFKDILNYINKNQELAIKDLFEKLLDGRKYNLKKPKYLAGALIYYFLIRNRYNKDYNKNNEIIDNINQNFIEHEFNFPKDTIARIFKTIYEYLKELEEYGPIYGIIDSAEYTFEDYKKFLKQEITQFREKIKLKEGIWNLIIQMYYNLLNSISFDILYENLKKDKIIHPKYLTASFLYYVLLINYEYHSLDELSEKLDLNPTSLRSLSSTIQDLLIKSNKYNFIRNYVRADKLSKNYFLEISFNFISLIIENVSNIRLLKTIPKSSTTNKIYSILKNLINNDDFDNFYKKCL